MVNIVEQNKALRTINRISRKLLAAQSPGKFGAVIQECLGLLGESINKSRVYLWKDNIDTNGAIYCTQIAEWRSNDTTPTAKATHSSVYYNNLPAFKDITQGDVCLSSLANDFLDIEIALLASDSNKVILIAPIIINDNRWGFIGVDNYDNDKTVSSIDENMLFMSGSMLASGIEKMNTETALREMEEHTQLMLNATPLCCNLWTSDFYNMRCNDEAVRLFELSSQAEYLERFNELSPQRQPNGRCSHKMAIEYITKALKEGYCRFEWLHQKLDGTPIPAEITLVRIKYQDDFIIAGYTRDLREEKAMLAEIKIKEALRIARDEALLNSKAKSNFLANMSHEIRSPMNAIAGFAEVILRENASEQTTENAQGIKDACNNLISIVNDILDISKIESGKMQICTSPYDLASMLNNVITISRMRLGKKPLMFTTNIDSHLPARLIGDENRIKQILLNILGNSIKYTDEGYVSLRVSGTVEGTKAVLRFSIKDSGIGIKSQDIDRLFVAFERVNTARNRNIEGTGLGLAISKQLCDMMEGNIQVISEYGCGSEFIVEIPQECPTYERLAQVTEPKTVLLYEPREHYRLSILETLENLDCKYVCCVNQSELYNNIALIPYDYILTAALHIKRIQKIVSYNKLQVPIVAFADYGESVSKETIYTILFPVNCLQLSILMNGQYGMEGFYMYNADTINFTAQSAKVLIVDDSPVNLRVALGLMSPYKFIMDTAESGAVAVAKVQQNQYDLVFMDHMMPEMDGIDTTAAIRQLPGDKYSSLPIIALTANAFVGMREVFIREGMNDFIAKPIDVSKLNNILLKWLPADKIQRLNSDEVIKPKEIFLEYDIAGVDTVKGIASVGGDQENYIQILSAYYADGNDKCFSLRQHIINNDIETFKTEVHTLKSTSATLGAMQISTMASKLEMAAQNNDIAFIAHNIDQFIAGFQTVLEKIRPIVANELSKKNLDHNRPDGDIEFLKSIIDSLITALELANISLIEKYLNQLYEFNWPPIITKELIAVQKYLHIFDYDNSLEHVLQLKKMC